MLPTVALIGRPNVGKSTLFNRLLGRNKALTHDRPGVTRDRIYGEVRRELIRPFALVDTGGLVFTDAEGFELDILDQAREAVRGSQAALLVVDAREGLTPMDQDTAIFLRDSGLPVICVANKVDGPEHEHLGAEFHALGFDVAVVSAAHGFGVPTLLETVDKLLDPLGPEWWADEDDTERGLRLTMLGRPNAGKSSMVNALVGEHRLIVSPQAGTTRDSVDVTFERGDKRYTFVDTAGVRRKDRITDSLERFSTLKALKASKLAQVAVLVMDATAGVTMQDKKLLAFLDHEKTPFLVAVNKIDLVPRPALAELRKSFQEAMRICPHVPLVYTSCLSLAGLGGLLPLAEQIWEECGLRVGTGELNRAMATAIERHQPPTVKRRRAKFYYMTQPETHPSTFVIFVNDPDLVKDTYVRYLENQLRKLFGITTAPMRVMFRSSHERKEGDGRPRRPASRREGEHGADRKSAEPGSAPAKGGRSAPKKAGGKAGASARPGRPAATGKPGKPDKSGKPAATGKSGKSGKPDKTGWAKAKPPKKGNVSKGISKKPGGGKSGAKEDGRGPRGGRKKK